MGLTLEVLADRAGITPHHLSAIETGKAEPRLGTVLALARALGRVPPGELLGASGDFSPAAAEVAKLFDRAPDEMRDLVVRLLRFAQRPRR
ncbi:MAG: helix-turn-helix transcriptional regulator [Candidatus Eisenbacteria bacterium]|nr:helix-turn-helix transcriptional regulator [Candidatus Eisenbacteria bacterium]